MSTVGEAILHVCTRFTGAIAFTLSTYNRAPRVFGRLIPCVADTLRSSSQKGVLYILGPWSVFVRIGDRQMIGCFRQRFVEGDQDTMETENKTVKRIPSPVGSNVDLRWRLLGNGNFNKSRLPLRSDIPVSTPTLISNNTSRVCSG